MSIMKTLTIDGQTYDLSMKNLLDGTASGSLHTPTTTVSSRGQTVLGEYNIPDLSGGNNSRGNYSLIVGNGYQAARSNALTLDWNGNLNTIGNLTAGGNLMTLGMAGVIQMFGGENPPPGWLICDGSAVSRSTYPELFDAIGINWGVGDGSTTFNLPDLRGRTVIGAGSGTGLTTRTLGDMSIGAETHNHGGHDGDVILSSGQSGNQSLSYTDTTYKLNTTNRKPGTSTAVAYGTSITATSTARTIAAKNATTAHNHTISANSNLQPSSVVNFIIATGKINI